MAKKTDISGIAPFINKELTVYSRSVQEKVDAAGRKAIKDLVKLTKKTAPKGDRDSGNFAASIASREEAGDRGSRFFWYVKDPNHRLTHLLVHGHATKDGGRTKADPFLQNAVDEILPQYEEDVKEACRG